MAPGIKLRATRMVDPLALLRDQIDSVADAVRWSCVLEATAPKPGNVYPGRDFADLSYADFISASDLTAKAFADSNTRISKRMLAAVTSVRKASHTNVNLGIVLLLGPLVAADEAMKGSSSAIRRPEDWNRPIAGVLSRFDGQDGRTIYAAIRAASAGGIGKVDKWDVNDELDEVDIVTAMKQAADQDRVARQYSTNYRDLLSRVVPELSRSIQDTGDLLSGIVHAQIRLLAAEPDSLIRRKRGEEVASGIQKDAGKIDLKNAENIKRFDRDLRRGGHDLNPGTTADLIAAALFVMLRTPESNF